MQNKYGVKFQNLRKKAEEALKSKNESPDEMGLEINELIHELEVHQIELEMQNEDLINTQIELEDSRRAYLDLYDFAPVGYFTLDQDGIIKMVNLTGTNMLGKPRKFIINSAFILYVAPDYKKLLHSHFSEVIKTQIKKQCDIELISSDKKPFYASLDTMPIFDEDDTFKGFRIILADNNRRKEAEKKVEEFTYKLQATIDAIPDLMFEVNEKGTIYDYNAPSTSREHINPQKFIGKNVSEVFPTDASDKIMEAIKEASKKGKHMGMTYHLTLPDGKKYFELSIARKSNSSLENHYIVLVRDISERVEVNKKLKRALKEREILIKEIHHRVKNNLMVMSSLLNLQADYVKDKASYEMFMESKNRAKSMALIHERLYQSTDLRDIDFGDYVQSLAMDLYRTYVNNPQHIKLDLDLDKIKMDINTILPCGLIINELLSNAFKHAFPLDLNGEVKIRFRAKDENLILEVIDTGIGFPESIDFKMTESLGLKLVNVLTQQIDGEIKMNADKGTKFTIIFPETNFKDD